MVPYLCCTSLVEAGLMQLPNYISKISDGDTKLLATCLIPSHIVQIKRETWFLKMKQETITS